jgi:hypothetical protein
MFWSQVRSAGAPGPPAADCGALQVAPFCLLASWLPTCDALTLQVVW